MTSAPTHPARARPLDDDGDSSLPFVVGLVVAVMIHAVAFSGFAAAQHFNLLDFLTGGTTVSPPAAPSANADPANKPKSDPASDPKLQKPIADEDRKKLMQTLLPPKKPDIAFGKEGSESTSIAWISYDDYQDLIAAKGKTEQPALQSQVDPLAGAPIRPDPTPPQPQARVALNPQNRAIEPGPLPKPGEMKPHRVAPAAAASPEAANQAHSQAPAPPVQATAAPEAPAPVPEQPAAVAPAKKVPDPFSPSEAPKVYQAAASPVRGQGHDIDVGHQQPGVPLPDNAAEAPGGSGAASDQIAMGPLPSAHQGQTSPLPTPSAHPTEIPAAPKPNAPAVNRTPPTPPISAPSTPTSKVPTPPAPAQQTPAPPIPTTQKSPVKPTPEAKAAASSVAPAAPAQAHAPATLVSPGNPAPLATGPHPGPTDSDAGEPSALARPTGAPKSDRESAPVSLTDSPLPARPGRVIAGNGIEIKTAFPQFSAIALSTSIPANPEVKVVFDRDGAVIDAQITKSSTYPNIDGPILASLYKWKATGHMLEELNAPFSVTIRIILINEE